MLVVIQPDTDIQVPGKLYEMLPFRKPLLALTGDGATADVVRQYNLGTVVDPRQPADIAEAILTTANGARRCGLGAGWDAALAAFEGRRLTEDLARLLDRLPGVSN